jgi:hypothetical protein
MSAQKVTDVEHILYNGKPHTVFKLWRLVNNAWVFQDKYGVKGHFVRHSTLLKKRQEMLQEKS